MSLSLSWGWLGGFVFAFGGMTFLFPLLAIFTNRLLGTQEPGPSLAPELGWVGLKSLEVLIPTYNEADTIEATLSSVLRARDALLAQHPGTQISITVALDGSNEETRAIVQKFTAPNAGTSSQPLCKVLDRGFNLGKWKTLEELAQQASADWSALVDAGTLWPERFLLTLLDQIQKDSHSAHPPIGYAPGYHQERAGKLEHLSWWVERSLKKIENLAGGPISLHGATMIFKTPVVKNAFGQLEKAAPGRKWLNDDVVLGLWIRTLGKIHYFGSQLLVSDCGVRSNVSEMPRRTRLLAGNVEWIHDLFPHILCVNPTVGILAFRRIFRFFWAYNLILSALCLCFWLQLPASLLAAGLVLGVLAFAMNRRLRDAGVVALTGPLRVLQTKRSINWS